MDIPTGLELLTDEAGDFVQFLAQTVARLDQGGGGAGVTSRRVVSDTPGVSMIRWRRFSVFVFCFWVGHISFRFIIRLPDLIFFDLHGPIMSHPRSGQKPTVGF
jgi:hypothetical protein